MYNYRMFSEAHIFHCLYMPLFLWPVCVILYPCSQALIINMVIIGTGSIVSTNFTARTCSYIFYIQLLTICIFSVGVMK